MMDADSDDLALTTEASGTWHHGSVITALRLGTTLFPDVTHSRSRAQPEHSLALFNNDRPLSDLFVPSITQFEWFRGIFSRSQAPTSTSTGRKCDNHGASTSIQARIALRAAHFQIWRGKPAILFANAP